MFLAISIVKQYSYAQSSEELSSQLIFEETDKYYDVEGN